MNKEIWVCDWKKHAYKRIKQDEPRFMLIQIGGSLSSTITYESKEDAIADGWKLKEELGEYNQTSEKLVYDVNKITNV